MNFFIAIVSVLMTINISVNAAKSKQEVRDEAHELIFDFLLITKDLEVIGKEMKEDLLGRYRRFRGIALSRSLCKFNAKRRRFRTLVSTAQNTTGFLPIYEKCFEHAELKLRNKYESIYKRDCYSIDLGPYNHIMTELRTVGQEGNKTVSDFGEEISKCEMDAPYDAGSNVPCMEEKISNARNSYADFHREYVDAKFKVDMARKNLHSFPCFRRRINKFCQHANTLQQRIELCIRDKNIGVLNYTKSDLLLPCIRKSKNNIIYSP